MIRKEDYEEPRCLLSLGKQTHDDDTPIQMIPVSRIIDKLDHLLDQNNYHEAERLLLYWEQEAKALKDQKGQLTITNELVGLYRKLGNKDKVLIYTNICLELLTSLDLGVTFSVATTYLNIGTAYKFLNENEKALTYYRLVENMYTKTLPSNDYNWAGLYNNMGIAMMSLKHYDEALRVFNQALAILDDKPHHKIDQAITYLNIADLYELKLGLIDGSNLIDKAINEALKILNDQNITRDGYYAFVCEKCETVLRYYGYFSDASEIKERAQNIYERNRTI